LNFSPLAQAQVTRFLLEAPRQIGETEHVALFREVSSLTREAIIRVTDVDTTPDYSDVIVESGQTAFTFGGIDYVFGGRLDSYVGPINDPFLNQPGNTFRGVTANGGYVTFYGAMVDSNEYLSIAPFAAISTKIGLFRANISGATPVIEAIAVHGEPINNFLFYIDQLFNTATWEINPYDTIPPGYRMNVPPRGMPLHGWVAPVSMNSNGYMAFRSEIMYAGEIHGAIFQHLDSPDRLGMIAVENVGDRPIHTGLFDIGDVVPQLLGPPVISDDQSVAFYSVQDDFYTGVFSTPGGPLGLHALMHGNSSGFEIGANLTINAPALIDPRSAGAEANQFAGFWFDQPSINCHGDIAFRTTVRFQSTDTEFIPCVVRWTKASGDFDLLFKKTDLLPPRVDGSPVVPAATLTTRLAKQDEPFSTFSRPKINGHGEVTVVAQISDSPIPNPDNDVEEALLLYDRNDQAWTLARTRSAQWQVIDPGPPSETYQIRAFGSYQDTASPSTKPAAPYFKNPQINDYGQVLVSLNTFRLSDDEQRNGIGHADAGSDFQIDRYNADLGTLIISGGSSQDGDRGFERAGGDAAFGALWVVDQAPVNFDPAHLVIGPDPTISVAYPDQLAACIADINRDGKVDTADLGMLVGQFGAQCPCTADLNGDGVVDTADLGILIGAFGQFCDGCADPQGSAPESLMAPPGAESPNPLLSEFGFSNSEDYSAWLETLTPAQLEAHLSDCLEIIRHAE
jgi:hypothetical protein